MAKFCIYSRSYEYHGCGNAPDRAFHVHVFQRRTCLFGRVSYKAIEVEMSGLCDPSEPIPDPRILDGGEGYALVTKYKKFNHKMTDNS